RRRRRMARSRGAGAPARAGGAPAMRHVLRRLGWSVFVVWGVVSIAFVVNTFVPGDPARMVAGAQARPADVERIRQQLGLGEPAVVQYGRLWKRLVHRGPRAVDPKAEPAHAN